MKALLKTIVVAILSREAKLILTKYKPKIIAVTGSVGKTATKDAIYTALSAAGLNVKRSKKSLNSETGVPLTILGCESGWGNPLRWLLVFARGLMLVLYKKDYPEWLVLEVGTDEPGDMQAIAKWLRPDVVVITALPSIPVHLSNFSSIDAVVQEKLSLARALKHGGVLVLNGDDDKVREVAKEFTGRNIFYTNAGSTAEIAYANNRPTGIRYQIPTAEGAETVFLRGVLGQQWVYLILAALGVCEALGLNQHEAAKALENYEAPPGRMRILEGIKNTTIIDDSYNSSPIAMSAALDALAKLEAHGRKIAVLGDMRELGSFSEREHRSAGERVAQVADILVTVGEESQVLSDAAEEAGMQEESILRFGYYDSARAGEQVRELIKEGDAILVKGSQNKIRTEHIVKAIMEEPDRAGELLVRQEPEWLSRK